MTRVTGGDAALPPRSSEMGNHSTSKRVYLMSLLVTFTGIKPGRDAHPRRFRICPDVRTATWGGAVFLLLRLRVRAAFFRLTAYAFQEDPRSRVRFGFTRPFQETLKTIPEERWYFPPERRLTQAIIASRGGRGLLHSLQRLTLRSDALREFPPCGAIRRTR